MSKINFNWKVGYAHLCKITNPQKDNYGKIIRVYRGNSCFYSRDHDDWYEEDYNQDDFIVTDVDNETSSVKVNVDNENYWKAFTSITARQIFINMQPGVVVGTEEDMAKTAVRFAVALTEELKKL